MAYNLPPPWDPGFALPENVSDEGLERRGFVTRQMPRGTYDQPKVGTGGYAVPQYVMDEGYGQGTFTTKWEPRGSYDGGRIPQWIQRRPKTSVKRLPGGGAQIAFSGVSGEAPMPEPFASYGARAAEAIIAQVANVPPLHRTKALKAILNKVDRTLWKRTADIATRYAHQGMSSAQAFRAALARALSAGAAAEIIQAGRTGSAPQANSLLGLGCYGCAAALGETRITIADALATAASRVAQAGCTLPPGYTYVAATATVPAHLERLRAGQVPVQPPPGFSCSVAVSAPSDVSVPKPITGSSRGPQSAEASKYFKVGPFPIYYSDIRDGVPAYATAIAETKANPKYSVITKEYIPSDWIPIIQKALSHKFMDSYLVWDTIVSRAGSRAAAEPYLPWLAMFGIGPDTKFNLSALGLQRDPSAPYKALGALGGSVGGGAGAGAAQIYNAILAQRIPYPVAKSKDPVSGKEIAIFFYLGKVANTRDHRIDAPKEIMALSYFVSKVYEPRSIWGAIWDGVKALVMLPVDAAKAALNELGELACDLVNSSIGQAGAEAAAMSAGAPPGTGTAGVQIARNAGCAPGAPAPAMPPPAPASSTLLPLAMLGGAGVLAILLLKKKKATP